MIHLFNNVFIEQDSRLTVFYKVVVISDQYNRDMITNPRCLYCTDSLDNLLANRSLEHFLREMMQIEEKVVIYANNEAFARIISCWFKSSTNMQKAEYDFYVECYKEKCIAFNKHNSQLFDLMKFYWVDAPSYDFSDVDFGPSFEFAIASAFYNPNFSKKNKLINLLSRFIRREYEFIILEAREHIDQYGLDDHVQELLGNTTSEIMHIRDLPRMSIYKAPFFNEEIDILGSTSYLPGKISKLDINLCTDEELKELCDITDDILLLNINSSPPYSWCDYDTLAQNFEARGWKYLNSVKNNGLLTEEEYQQVLQEIINERLGVPHAPLDLIESILSVIITYFRSLVKKGNMEKLYRYSLK